MARGKVIDPDGMQQAQPSWGYIQRFDGPDWPGTENWPWPLCRKKVIPFYNERFLKTGTIVNFDIEPATLTVIIKGEVLPKDGQLAIALNVFPEE